MGSGKGGEEDIFTSPPVASPSRPKSSRAPALLPAFEPFSSSPLPRPQKRKLDGSPPIRDGGPRSYPTPVPTSSTGILPSSPPRRPPLQRTTSAISTLSQRNPLGAVPTVDLAPNGEPLLLGRSSNSSNFQLPASRLISRVHLRATYHQPDQAHASGSVRIECLGWNGAKVHCRGQVYELSKGGSFVSDKPSAEIMVDVQDTRVVVAWPVNVGTRSESALSDRTWTEDASPRRALSAPRNRIASSPPPMAPRSPMSSPTPANRSVTSAPQMFTATSSNDIAGHSLVEVYEDPNSDPEPVLADQPVSRSPNAREALSATDLVKSSRSSFLSNEEFSDNDEENDPIVHSFGPFGENILPRLQSISTSASTDPPSQRRRKPLRATSNSPQKRTSSESTHQGSTSGLGIGISGDAAGESSFDGSPVKNHVINQLAFSRLSALPLSTIFGNLPTALKGVESSATAADSSATALTSPVLKDILVGIPCVGEISREGKDAAGKPLENEYYYVPEMDSDSMRREAVTSSRGGTGLRAARKNHKQYFWKRPRH